MILEDIPDLLDPIENQALTWLDLITYLDILTKEIKKLKEKVNEQ